MASVVGMRTSRGEVESLDRQPKPDATKKKTIVRVARAEVWRRITV
ncbi:MAG TPA: hypothetical protein VFT57_03120 [Gemmatimonadaceae bacterium]|nr:hypothetical protein [Gemmatimonadaceae bacterium]HEU6450383.1 hypothetical protein [Gemmatimonadaceae bacterium]